jgi:hypothetical protein
MDEARHDRLIPEPTNGGKAVFRQDRHGYGRGKLRQGQAVPAECGLLISGLYSNQIVYGPDVCTKDEDLLTASFGGKPRARALDSPPAFN